MLNIAPILTRKHHHRRRHFLAAWIRAPLRVGALMPSSRVLARALANQINISAPGMVIELGAGTGVVTHALIECGIDAKHLLVVEREANLHGILSHEFPDHHIVCGDACELDALLSEHKIRRVNAIVSSLPLLSMNKKIRRAIEQQMLSAMGEEGMIVQFTYGPQSPISRGLLRKHQVAGKRVKTVLANMPPAHVWVYKKSR